MVIGGCVVIFSVVTCTFVAGQVVRVVLWLIALAGRALTAASAPAVSFGRGSGTSRRYDPSRPDPAWTDFATHAKAEWV